MPIPKSVPAPNLSKYKKQLFTEEKTLNKEQCKKKMRSPRALLAALLGVAVLCAFVGCTSSKLADREGSQEIIEEIDLTDLDHLYEEYVRLPILSGVTARSWNNPHEIDPVNYINYYVYYVLSLSDYTQDKYADGFPAEELESYILQYFDLSLEHLRDTEMYDAEKRMYYTYGVGGAGEPRVASAVRDGDVLQLNYEIYSSAATGEYIWGGTLTVKFSGDSYKYIANVQYYPD